MLLHIWSEMVDTGDTDEVQSIRQPSWALTEAEAVSRGTEGIRDELDDGADEDEIADVHIFSVEFQPNERTIAALLNTATLNVGSSVLVEDQPTTTINVQPLRVLQASDVEPTPDDDDSDIEEEEKDEFHIPKDD